MLVKKLPMLRSTQRGLLAAGVITMVLLLYAGQRPQPVAPLWASRAAAAGDVPDDGHTQRWQDCRRLLRMSNTQFTWESDDGGGGEQARCRRTQRSDEDLRQSLQKLKELRGRPARLVFIGDSRIRILHETLIEKLELKPLNSSNLTIFYATMFHPREELQRDVPSRESLPELSPGCVEANVNRVKAPRAPCSSKLTINTLQSEFWWRTYMDGRFTDQLDKVLSDCATGKCPDLVILDNGAWYASAVTLQFPSGHAVARATRFIDDICEVRAKIARLAAQTRVLWKHDEHFMGEPLYNQKNTVTRTFMVLSSVIYETTRHAPDLNVWSSNYAEAMRFYHQVCRPNWGELRKSKVDPVRDECKDPMHVGGTERWRQAQTILNVLLQDITEPAAGFCCGK